MTSKPNRKQDFKKIGASVIDFVLNLRENVARLRFELQKITKIIYPINWTKLQEYDIVIYSLQNANRYIKSILAVTLVGLVISCVFLLQGFYLILTVNAADTKGTINEAVFGQNIDRLNPLLSSNNDTERKVIDLIYQPLYRVIYPDFLSSNNQTISQPTIEPVLLEAEPQWKTDLSNPNSKILVLKLKNDLKWSDSSPLTTDDVIYSFDRLKESSGNSDFRDIFANYKLTATTPRDMELTQINTSKGFNPQIKYLLNFYPVSHQYFEDKKTDDLINNPKSIQNEVSSGWFTIPYKVKIEGKDTKNPIQDNAKGFNTIVLERNKYNQYKPIFVDKYVIKTYTDLVDVGGTNNNSVERASVNKKVDLFVRQPSFENKVTSTEISSRLGLSQQISPTNTYYILYANLQSNQWLINSLLRKYVFCNLAGVGTDRAMLSSISYNKQFLPVQFGVAWEPNCGNSKQELLSQQKNNRTIYTQKNNDITLDGDTINLNILTLDELTTMVKPIQEQLKTIGIDSNITSVKDADQLDIKISEKTYNLVFLPTTIISSDPYPMYGAKSRNISTINKNNRIGKEETKYGEGVEKLLKEYSESEPQSKNAREDIKNQLVEVFKNEFVSMNIYRSNLEINYSNRLNIDRAGFGKAITFSVNVYESLPLWYTETRRKFLWG